MYPDFRIIKWTATEISKSRSCHGGEARGRKGRKETNLWEKSNSSCSVNTFVGLYQQESSENETDELWNYSVILWSSIIWKLLYLDQFHISIKPCEVGNYKVQTSTTDCHLKHTLGDNSQDFQLHKTRRLDWVRIVSLMNTNTSLLMWGKVANVRQRLTQLSILLFWPLHPCGCCTVCLGWWIYICYLPLNTTCVIFKMHI